MIGIKEKLTNIYLILHELGGTGAREKYSRAAEDADLILQELYYAVEELIDIRDFLEHCDYEYSSIEQAMDRLSFVAGSIAGARQ